MNEKQKLADYIGRTYNITDQEIADFVSAFKKVRIKKQQFIVQPNFVARHLTTALSISSRQLCL